MKTILVAVDLTGNSKNAFIRALQLAELANARLHILHVTHIPHISGNESEIVTSHASIRKEIEEFVQKHGALDSKNYLIHLINHGRPRDRIFEYSNNCNADLIITGMSARTKDTPTFSFSRVELIIWETHRPVLMVSKQVGGSYKNILLATGLTLSAEDELKPVFDFGNEINITLMGRRAEIVPTQGLSGLFHKMLQKHRLRRLGQFITDARSLLKKRNVSEEKIVYKNVEDSSAEALIYSVKKDDIDVLALGLRHTGTRTPVIDTTLREIIKAAPCDILIKRIS